MTRWEKRQAKKAQRRQRAAQQYDAVAAPMVDGNGATIGARDAGPIGGAADIAVTRESRPRSVIDLEDVLDRRHTEVTYANGLSNPFTLYFAQTLPNADPIVIKFGSWENVGVYKGMWRRHPWLVGICDQRVELACRPRVIVPNDPSDSRSVEITNEAKKLWRKVGEKATVIPRWFKYARFLGYAGVEKVFARDSASGLIYPAKLIARESENIRARSDGMAVWLSAQNPTNGDVIPQRKMMMLRGGTNDTFYGEAELQHVYPVTFWLEKSVELAFDSIEEFGRAIPHIKMPRLMDLLSETEREKVRSWARAYHRSYLETPTDGTSVDVEMMGANIATSGAVGRPELSLVEMCIAWAYIRILRVVQTLQKTGGSRALEEARMDVTSAAARPDSMLIDDGLNARMILPSDYTGWLTDFLDLNFPNEAEEQLCRFETPTIAMDDISALHKMATELTEVGARPSKQWYYKTTGLEEALDESDILGSPRDEPIGTTTTVRQDLSPAKKIAVAMEDGQVLHFDEDALVATNRGMIPASLLPQMSGLEIYTSRRAVEE